MPPMHVFGETIGLAPVAQVALLPALSVLLATYSETPRSRAACTRGMTSFHSARDAAQHGRGQQECT